MRLIGLDISYAKDIQVAVLSSRGRLLWMFSVTPDRSLLETARRIHNSIVQINDALIVFEEPGLYNNRTTGLKLIKVAVMTETLLSESGFPVVQIDPKRWQKYVLGKIPKGTKKEASVAKAMEMFGNKVTHPLNNDEADALNIAYFAVKNSKQLLKEARGES